MAFIADIRTASLYIVSLSENKHHKFERTVDEKVGQRNKSNEEKLKLLKIQSSNYNQLSSGKSYLLYESAGFSK